MPMTSPAVAVPTRPAPVSTCNEPESTIRIAASLPRGMASLPEAIVTGRAIAESRHNCAAVACVSNGLACSSSTRSIARRSSCDLVPQLRRERAVDQRLARCRGRGIRSSCGRFLPRARRFPTAGRGNRRPTCDSVIAGSAATTDARIGAPSRSSSTPSAAGARTSCFPSGAGDGDVAVEQELHGVNRSAAFIQRAARLVTNLPAQPRQPEQFVDVREIKQRHCSADGRQAPPPAAAPAIAACGDPPARGWPPAPTTRPRRHPDRARRDGPARARDRRPATTGLSPRPSAPPRTRSTRSSSCSNCASVSSTSRVRVR